MQATEKELEKIAAATRRLQRPLHGKQLIGLRVGRVLGRFKMGKHYQITIEEHGFFYARKPESIEREKQLDGIYIIRTNVDKEVLSSSEVVRSYKQLSHVEEPSQLQDRGSQGEANPSPASRSRPSSRLPLHARLLREVAYAEKISPAVV
jgi:hypothetical protein